MTEPIILILDDDQPWLEQHQQYLEKVGLKCVCTQLADDAVEIAKQIPSIQFALIDEILFMPVGPDERRQEIQHWQGLRVVQEIAIARPDIQFIMVTYAAQQRSDGSSEVLILEEERLSQPGVIVIIHKYALDANPDRAYSRLIETLKRLQKPIVSEAPKSNSLQIIPEERKATVPLQAIANPITEEVIRVGPYIDWQGPTDSTELQSFFTSAPDFQDIGFLIQAIKCASSVCRIEISNLARMGTGVLIADNLVLTNYHVLKRHENEDMQENARNTRLRFGYYTLEDGKVAEGQIFKLAAESPFLSCSPAHKLDYVLLQVDDSIRRVKSIQPASYALNVPLEGTGIHVLQHPEGRVMQVAITSNGITGVYKDTDRIQYVSRTSAGSSGAPCFNKDWKIVALHHAEQPMTFANLPIAIGTIREGILFSSIYEEIQPYLPASHLE